MRLVYLISLLHACWDFTRAAYTPCIAVQDRQIVCLGPGFAFQHTFTIACPVGHSPYIHDARYRIHDESSCPTSIDSYSCDAEDLQKRFRDECSRASEPCQVVVQYNPKHFCVPEKQGTHFVEVKVECVPGVNSAQSNIITMCDQRIHNGPYVSLHSKLPSEVGNGRAIEGTSCFCALTVPPNSMVAITAESMVKSPPPSSPAHQCDQKVSIQAFKFSEKFLPICQQDDPTSLDKRILEMTCDTELYRTVLVKYESSDRTVGTSFILKFNASYTAPFWLQCGLTTEHQIEPVWHVWETTSTLSADPSTKRTSTTTVSPNKRPAPPGNNQASSLSDIFIGGVTGGVVALLVLILLAVVLYRRRHRQQTVPISTSASNIANNPSVPVQNMAVRPASVQSAPIYNTIDDDDLDPSVATPVYQSNDWSTLEYAPQQANFEDFRQSAAPVISTVLYYNNEGPGTSNDPMHDDYLTLPSPTPHSYSHHQCSQHLTSSASPIEPDERAAASPVYANQDQNHSTYEKLRRTATPQEASNMQQPELSSRDVPVFPVLPAADIGSASALRLLLALQSRIPIEDILRREQSGSLPVTTPAPTPDPDGQ